MDWNYTLSLRSFQYAMDYFQTLLVLSIIPPKFGGNATELESWIEEAVHDVAFSLRRHKFQANDLRYRSGKGIPLYLQFPDPPLRKTHWQVRLYRLWNLIMFLAELSNKTGRNIWLGENKLEKKIEVNEYEWNWEKNSVESCINSVQLKISNFKRNFRFCFYYKGCETLWEVVHWMFKISLGVIEASAAQQRN